MKLWIASLCAIALASCNKPAGGPPSAPESDAATASVAAPDAGAPPAKAKAAPNPTAVAAGATPMLAYVYSWGLEVPAGKVRALADKHEAECVDAGPSVCQVTGSNIQASGRDRVQGGLSLRATAAWIARFKTTLAGDVQGAGGRLATSAVSSEDLTRQVVDTEAVVRAKTALRDRLQTTLETRPGKIDDLVDLETKLADVQGDLDATQSELVAMRERVAMSEVKISYDSAGVFAPEGVWTPVADAAHKVVGAFAGSLAFLVMAAGVLAPWALALGAAAWVAFAVRRRGKSARPRAAARAS